MNNLLGALSFIELGGQELRDRFVGNFVGVKTEASPDILPFYVEEIGISQNKLKLAGSIADPKMQNWIPARDVFKEEEILYVPPSQGMRNIRDSVFLYELLPRRVRTKGLCGEKGRLWSPFENITFNNPQTLLHIFNPNYYSVADAIEALETMRARAISEHFWISKGESFGTEYKVLHYKRVPVGVYASDAFALSHDCAHLREELSSICDAKINVVKSLEEVANG